MRDVRESIPSVLGAPSGPKAREWGKPQNRQTSPQASTKAFGRGPQGYNKPVGFVKAEDGNAGRDSVSEERQLQPRTDEELEAEKKELRRQDEEISFKDVRFWFTYLVIVTHECSRSVNVDTNHENGREFKPWNAQSLANEARKRLKNAIGSKLKLAWKYGMTMRAMSYSTSIGMYPHSLF